MAILCRFYCIVNDIDVTMHLVIKMSICFSDTMGNKGAFITLKGDDLTPKFTTYEAVVIVLSYSLNLCIDACH